RQINHLLNPLSCELLSRPWKSNLSTEFIKFKLGDCRAQPSGLGRRVIVTNNERCPIQNLPNHRALLAYALAVNDANKWKAPRARFEQVFLNDGFDLFGGDRMQIDHVAYLHLHRRV